MTLRALQQGQGARFAADGIPLHFGAQEAAWQAALSKVVLLDRSHEARLRLEGSSALDLLQRISTNDVAALAIGSACPTIFTNWHGRILERVEVYRQADSVLLLGGPGRAAALSDYLRRNIFFNDDVRIRDLSPELHQFDLVGPEVATLAGAPASAESQLWRRQLAGHDVLVAQRRSPGVPRYSLLLPEAEAAAVWQALCAAGALPAGSLVFNALRVRAGRPAPGSELTADYIPLELGLWDEVSFSKGCYTGQEIIARMESRGQLAKMMVLLRPQGEVNAPAKLQHEGRVVGRLTSSVVAPDGVRHALGVLRRNLAQPGTELQSQGTTLTVCALAGAQPGYSPEKSGAG